MKTLTIDTLKPTQNKVSMASEKKNGVKRFYMKFKEFGDIPITEEFHSELTQLNEHNKYKFNIYVNNMFRILPNLQTE